MGLVFVAREISAEYGSHAERGEEILLHGGAGDTLGLCKLQVALRTRPHGGERREHGLMSAPLAVHAAHSKLIWVDRGVNADRHELLGILEWQAPKQKRVNNAKNGCRCRDAGGYRGNDRPRKTGRGAKEPECVAHVVCEIRK